MKLFLWKHWHNVQNRISSSNESRGDLIGLSDIASLNLERYKFDNWEKVIDSVFLNKKNDAVG